MKNGFEMNMINILSKGHYKRNTKIIETGIIGFFPS